MFSFIKGQFSGIIIGFKYGKKVIKEESKWYIIPFMFDIILLPVKLIVVNLMCLTKRGREIILPIGREILEEVED